MTLDELLERIAEEPDRTFEGEVALCGDRDRRPKREGLYVIDLP